MTARRNRFSSPVPVRRLACCRIFSIVVKSLFTLPSRLRRQGDDRRVVQEEKFFADARHLFSQKSGFEPCLGLDQIPLVQRDDAGLAQTSE